MKRDKMAKILKKANQIGKAIEAEAEDILEDAELTVKDTVPASSVNDTLSCMEKLLENEGIEALFARSTSKMAMKRTASEKLSDSEVKEIAKVVADAVVDEMEDVLKDADEVCDEECKKLMDDEDSFEDIEGSFKTYLERKLAHKQGIHVKFARKQSKKAVKASKKVTAASVKDAMEKRRKARNK